MDNNNSEWPETPTMMLSNLLREIRMKYVPDYRFENNQMAKETNGVASCELYECFCLVGPQYRSSGRNQNKGTAKHIAAENMLRLLDSKGKLGKFRLPGSSFIAEEDTFGDNPISRLHEFLQCRGIEKPIFDDDKYGTQYEVRCGIFQLKMETTARNASKKLAKKAAAKDMINKLEQMDSEGKIGRQIDGNSDSHSINDDLDQIQSVEKNLHSYLGIKNMYGAQITLGPSVLAELHRTNQFVKVLEDILERYEVEYDLIEINSKNMFGLYQVICRLRTIPVVTVPGVGKSIELAKQAAAHQAIEALNIGSRRMAFREKVHNFGPKQENKTE